MSVLQKSYCWTVDLGFDGFLHKENSKTKSTNGEVVSCKRQKNAFDPLRLLGNFYTHHFRSYTVYHMHPYADIPGIYRWIVWELSPLHNISDALISDDKRSVSQATNIQIGHDLTWNLSSPISLSSCPLLGEASNCRKQRSMTLIVWYKTLDMFSPRDSSDPRL